MSIVARDRYDQNIINIILVLNIFIARKSEAATISYMCLYHEFSRRRGSKSVILTLPPPTASSDPRTYRSSRKHIWPTGFTQLKNCGNRDWTRCRMTTRACTS